MVCRHKTVTFVPIAVNVVPTTVTALPGAVHPLPQTFEVPPNE
jgi:hypothetical protein